jgi:L-seryl-tRNA(Ser) seleniumtransferase
MWNEGLSDIPDVTAERRYPSEAGQPHGRTIVTLADTFPKSRDQVVAELWDRNPRIAVSEIDTNAFALNPQTLETGEDRIVLTAVREVLTSAAKGN